VLLEASTIEILVIGLITRKKQHTAWKGRPSKVKLSVMQQIVLGASGCEGLFIMHIMTFKS